LGEPSGEQFCFVFSQILDYWQLFMAYNFDFWRIISIFFAKKLGFLFKKLPFLDLTRVTFGQGFILSHYIG